MWFPGLVLFFYTATALLTPKYKLRYCILFLTPLWIVLMIIRIYLTEIITDPIGQSVLLIGNTIIVASAFFVCIVITCREKILRKLFVTIIVYATLVLAEFLTISVFAFALGEDLSIEVNTLNLGGLLSVLLVQAALCSVLIIFWNRKKIETREDFIGFGLFLLLPLSQILLLNGLISISMQYGYSYSPAVFAGAIIGFFANLVLLRLLFTNMEKHALEIRLKGFEHMQELERARFEVIEAKQLELAKIRHDFNNQLVTAYRLAEQNKHGEAAGMLDALSAALAETQEKTFCANHVVNVILAEKQKICETAGITLDTNVALEENCGVEPLHLCSVFSNLLDNAINACREIPDSIIKISALQRGDYIHIKCVNPIPEAAKNGSGYGTRILADITERYEGAYNAETIDGQYSAVISLLSCRVGVTVHLSSAAACKGGIV